MKRTFLKVLLSLTVLAMALSAAGHLAAADSLYVRKVVSVVLDDSGSMSGDRWNYAVYALQNLAAMLNPGDTLLVTRLNRGGTVQYDVTDSGLDATLSRMRNQQDPVGGTKFKPVLQGFQELKNSGQTDLTTEYWLMVLTDGAFDFGGTQYRNLSFAFDDMLGETMPNGLRPKVVYLNIGSGSNVKENAERGLYVYSAGNEQEINNALSSVSDFVTGRKRFDSSSYQLVNDRTIRIQSDIPLANIVLLQNSQAKISDVQTDQNQRLTVTRNAETSQSISYYNTMRSTVSRVENLSGNIAPGTYTVTYDQAFRPEELTVLFEPAIEIRLAGNVEGRPLDRSAMPAAYAGDTLTASYRICESGSQLEIPLSLIPGAKAGITVTDDKNSRTDDPEIKWTLSAGRTQVTAWLDIPGFRRLEDTLILEAGKKPPAPGADPVEDITLTIGEFRHQQLRVTVTNHLIDYDPEGRETGRKELTTRQELIDNQIAVETQLPYDRNVLYGNDGRLYLDFYDDGTVTTGTWRVTVTWNGKVSLEFHVIITPSTYTVEAAPQEQSISLSEYLASPQTVSFVLLEDGKWPVSCQEHGLEVSSELPGTLSFDAAGNGIFTFSGEPKPSWGDYHLTPSLKRDTLLTPPDVIVHLVQSAAEIHTEPEREIRRQSEMRDPVYFTARMLIDGIAVPFETGHTSVTQPDLQDRMTVDLQTDGFLKIGLTAGLNIQPGEYPVEIQAAGGTGQAVLEIVASVFTITPEVSSLSLVTDNLQENQQGIRFLISADGRPLTEEEIRELNPQFSQGQLPEGKVTYEDGAVVYTPTAPEDWTLLPDGLYPVVCTLPDGTQASVDIALTMIKYEIVPVRDGQTISRESLVGSKEAVVFQILKDGRQMTGEEIQAVGYTLSTDDRHRNWVELNSTVNSSGEVEVIPSRGGWKFQASFAPLGDLPVTLTIKITPGTAHMNIRRGDFWEELLPYRIVPLLIILAIIGYIGKWTFLRAKFRYRSAVYKCDPCVTKGSNILIEGTNWSQHCRFFCWRMFFPWIRDRKRIQGTAICLQAAGGKRVRYQLRAHDQWERYYIADVTEVQPYESGSLPLGGLTEIDPAETDGEEEKPRRKKKAKWRSWSVGSCIVRFDGETYSIYCIKS